MSDIEQALAEAQHDVLAEEYFVTDESSPFGPEETSFDKEGFADALAATEPVQAIARDAAVGRAVEHISRWGMDGWTIECDSQDGTAYRVTVNGYDPKSSGWLPTLREALAVALGEDHD